MIIIISKRGIFDASGCRIYIEGIDYGVDFHQLKLTHMSNGHSETIAEFDTPKLTEDAYNEVLFSIKRGERIIQMLDHETMLRETDEEKPLC